jgi:hypothetical protein
MTCSFFDIGCHVQSGIWQWWSGLGLGIQLLIAGGLLAVVLGASLNILTLLKRVGGWPALAGGVAIIVGLVLAVLPRKPRGYDNVAEHIDPGSPDAMPPFGRPRPKRPAKPAKPPTGDTWFDKARRGDKAD